MAVKSENATVYRGGGRRWFTKYAAERAEAKAIINRRCECAPGDDPIMDGPYITPPYVCYYHNDRVKFERMVRLLVVMFVRKGAGA